MKYGIRLAAILLSNLFFGHLYAYQYDFAVCAIFQNEARFLKEWIEYHKIVGAQHFYLYNNDSQDDYLKVLQPYIDEGIVELVDWQAPDFQKSGQKKAYLDAINKTKDSVKWLAIIDLDEYLVPKIHDTIPAWLAEYTNDEIGGIGINWQMFGTSHVPKIEGNRLLTEKLTLKASENHSENIHIKSIVRPIHVVEPPHVHHFEYREGYHQINPNHEPFLGPFSPYITTDKIQINHYWTKDEEFLYETKIPRRQNWGESMESIESRVNALNQVEDTSIARFLPLLRKQMFPQEVWEEYKPVNDLDDIRNYTGRSPHVLQGGFFNLPNGNENFFFGQSNPPNVGQLIAELGTSVSELLSTDTGSNHRRGLALKVFGILVVVTAAIGAAYYFYLSKAHK